MRRFENTGKVRLIKTITGYGNQINSRNLPLADRSYEPDRFYQETVSVMKIQRVRTIVIMTVAVVILTIHWLKNTFPLGIPFAIEFFIIPFLLLSS